MTIENCSSPNVSAAANRTEAELHVNSAQHFASCLKAAGDALRLQILAVLASDSFGVLELSHIFDTKQSGMSHHLKVLARAELVSTRREGNTIFYRRSDTQVDRGLAQIRDVIYRSAEELLLDPKTQQNLDSIYQQRAEASRAFFRNNSEAFKQQQELIADFNSYGPEVSKVLDISPHPSHQHVLEVGPGVGEFLGELSARFTHVSALDSSELMLKRSREYALINKLDNVVFENGDTSKCAAWPGKFDCAVINMVLHHTPSPQQIFQDVAHALKAEGVLLVCDLGAHDQDWVRDACGDQWLGFSASDLKAWALKAGLHSGVSRFFALRNGFQIQIHQFIKN